ncbi:hypothetical protein EDD18DRAFT_1331823 [Armillaria luteobubalina]|uniref:Uncharacterized protein n=1 Tax=Armillaria luteobubalina TaxID=153913 RepID=A0AA39Q4V1_9AGAR|nr:hypothetical protein EDD18DRAFT_1331823 [Armillaria luteobubalina]
MAARVLESVQDWPSAGKLPTGKSRLKQVHCPEVYPGARLGFSRNGASVTWSTKAKHSGEVLDVLGHTLYDPELVMKSNGGKATMSSAACTFHRTSVAQEVDLSKEIRAPSVTCHGMKSEGGRIWNRIVCSQLSESMTGPRRTSEIPTLDELGLSEVTASVHRGENEVLRRLEVYCEDPRRAARVLKPKTRLAEFNPPETTALSPYLNCGRLGVNEFLWRIRETVTREKNIKVKRQETKHEPENPEGIDVLPNSKALFMSSFISYILLSRYPKANILKDDRTGMKTPKIDCWLEFKEDAQGFLGTMQSCDKWIGSTRPTYVAVALSRLQCYSDSGKSDKSELSNSARSWRSSPTNIFIPPISLPQILKRRQAGRAGFMEQNHEIPDGSAADDILRGSYKEVLGQVDYADSRRRFHVEAETGRQWR